MCELKLVRLRSAFWRLIEGATILAGAAGLMRLAHAVPDVWLSELFTSFGVVAMLIGFVAAIQAMQWLIATIIRGPFVMLGLRDANNIYKLHTLNAKDVQVLFNQEFLNKQQKQAG